MQVVYLSERPYRGVEEDDIFRNGGFFGLSNEQFDPAIGSRDYNYYLDEYLYAEQVGFDGLALNEHHGNPFCMGGVLDVEAAILARQSKTAKIVLIGNALATKNPLRLAEELATIDLISGGRLITGWVRGAGAEQFFNNVNPAFNREYFEEAHDFILRAWTEPGPWRYEGTHFHYRHVNPWTLPLQKPYPQMWVPGNVSLENAVWAAERSYTFVGLGTALSATCEMWEAYADTAAELGYQAGPENFGYLAPMVLADTDEKAQEIGRNFYFGGGHPAFAKAGHAFPAGYNTPSAIQRLARMPKETWLGTNRVVLELERDGRPAQDVDLDAARRRADATYQKAQASLQTIVGTPASVLPKVKTILDVLRPGALVIGGVLGNVSDEDRMRSVQLMGEELIPAIKEHARKIGLVDSFERLPGTVKLRAGERRTTVVDLAALRAAGLS